MIPWPLALVTLVYGIIAAASAARLYNRTFDSAEGSWVWPLVWLIIASAVVYGLPLFHTWARKLAIYGSYAMMLCVLGIAAVLVGQAQPLAGLLAGIAAGLPMVIIRYLRRPEVEASFGLTLGK